MRTHHSFCARSWSLVLVALHRLHRRAHRPGAGRRRRGRPSVRIPTLPAPEKKTIPVVQIAEAKGWPPGMKPHGAAVACR